MSKTNLRFLSNWNEIVDGDWPVMTLDFRLRLTECTSGGADVTIKLPDPDFVRIALWIFCLVFTGQKQCEFSNLAKKLEQHLGVFGESELPNVSIFDSTSKMFFVGPNRVVSKGHCAFISIDLFSLW